MIFITALFPTPENRKGPSSLPYSLLDNRLNRSLLGILYFNHAALNSDTMADTIKGLHLYECGQLTRRGKFGRYFHGIKNMITGLPHETAQFILPTEIHELDRFRTLLLYPSWLIPLFMRSKAEIYVLAPDSMALHHRRTMRHHPRRLTKFLACIRWIMALQLEKLAANKARAIYFVGRDDLLYYRKCGGKNGRYLVHPISKDML